MNNNNKNNIIGIFGNNAIGKSTIIDIITYLLFGRSARDVESLNPKDLINKQSNKAKGVLIFESNGKKYLIERTCTREKSKKKDKHVVRFYNLEELDDEEDNKNIYNFNGKDYKLISRTMDKTQTDRDIETIVGSYENFLNSSILLQGNNKTFKLKKDDERKKLLCEILNIDNFSNVSKIFTTRYTEINSIFETIIKDIAKICSLNTPLATVKSKFQTTLLDIKHDILPDYIKKHEELKHVIDEINESILNKNNEIIEEQNKIELLFESLSNIDKKYVNVTIVEIEEKIKKLQIENEKLLKERNDIELLKNKIDMEIINDEEKITNEYKIYCENIKDKKEQIILEINKLLVSKNNICKTFDNEKYDLTVKDIKNQIKNLNKEINSYKCFNGKNIIELIKQINDEINSLEVKKQLKEKDIQKIDYIYDDLLIEKQNVSIKIKNINKEIQLLELNEILSNKKQIIARYNNFINDKNKQLDESLIILKKSINDKQLNKEYLNELIDEITDTINILLVKNNINNHKIIKKYEELQFLENNYNKLIEEKEVFDNKLININHNLDIIKNNSEIKNQIELLKSEQSELKEELNQLNIYNNLIDQKIKYENHLEELIENKKNYDFNIEIDKQVQILNCKINCDDIIVNKYMLLQEQKNKLLEHCSLHKIKCDNIVDNENNIQQLENIISFIEKNNTVKNNIIYIKNYIKKLQSDLSDYQKQLLDLNKEYNILDNKIINIKNKLIDLDKIKDDHEIYKILNDSMNNNGLQLYLLEQSLNFINDKINFILNDSINKSVKLFMNEHKKIDMSIETDYGMVDSISGMESFMIDLAFKIVISQISEMPKSNMLFIDESISVLDHERLNNIDQLFNFISQYYNSVFLITHLQTVKNSMNCSLFISKKNNKSFINNSVHNNTNILPENNDDEIILDIIKPPSINKRKKITHNVV